MKQSKKPETKVNASLNETELKPITDKVLVEAMKVILPMLEKVKQAQEELQSHTRKQQEQIELQDTNANELMSQQLLDEVMHFNQQRLNDRKNKVAMRLNLLQKKLQSKS